MLVAASSARTPVDAKPDAAAMAILEKILATDPHPHRVRNRVVGWFAGTAAVVTAAVVGANLLVPSGAAVAGSPLPLDFSGTSTVSQTILDAQSDLASAAGPIEPERLVRSATWSFNVDVDARTSVVVPQLVTLQWEADQSGRITIIDGAAYDPADAEANQAAEVHSSGHESMDLTMAPGEFATPVASPPGATREELVAALTAFGMPEDPSAFDVLFATSSLLEQWTLTNAQESEILAILSTTDGATALGETTDRLGRPVNGLSVISTDGAARDAVLISSDTGRIVGFERTVLVGDDVLPQGAVIGYRLFDVPADLP